MQVYGAGHSRMPQGVIMKKVWSISLIVIASVSVVWAVSSFTGFELPDTLTRIMGAADMCAVVTLVYSSVKLRMLKDEQDRG